MTTTGSSFFIRQPSVSKSSKNSILRSTRTEPPPGLLIGRRLRRFKAYFFEHLRLLVKFSFARWKFVDAQHESQNVRVLLPGEAAGSALRHGLADAVKQVAHREAIPVRQERSTGQRRSGFSAGEHVAVASRTFLLVDRLATLGLFFGVNAIPDGTQRSVGHLSPERCSERRESKNCQGIFHLQAFIGFLRMAPFRGSDFILPPKAACKRCTHRNTGRR